MSDAYVALGAHNTCNTRTHVHVHVYILSCMDSVVDNSLLLCSSMTQDFHFRFDETFHIEISQWPESLKVQVQTTLYTPLGLKYMCTCVTL